MERLTLQNRGAEVVYRLRKGKTRKWVIFLPGACADHRTYAAQIPVFDETVNLLLVDQRGQGESAMAPGHKVDFLDMLDDLLQLCDRHGIGKASLIAHSYGCFVAQEFAWLHPQRVDRMVLIGCYDHHKRAYPNAWSEYIRVPLTYAMLALPWSLMANFSAKVSSNQAETQGMIREWLMRTGRRGFWQIGKSAHRRAHHVEGYEHPHPTLLIRGETDYPRVLGPVSDDMMRRNPLCQQVVIPSVGHVPHQDHPSTTNEWIERFLLQREV